MSQDLVLVVERLLAKAPHRLRHDLISNDPAIRRRAEETLAAMIAAALAEPKVLLVDVGAVTDSQR